MKRTAVKEKSALLPSTSPALPDVWVGECPVAGHPRQRPGCSAGPAELESAQQTSGILSLHRRSSACSRPDRWLLLVCFAVAKSTLWTDGIIQRVSVQDTGGTGGIHAPTPPSFIGRSPNGGTSASGPNVPLLWGSKTERGTPRSSCPCRGLEGRFALNLDITKL